MVVGLWKPVIPSYRNLNFNKYYKAIRLVEASGVIGEGSDSFPIVEEIEAKKRGIRCAFYSKLLKLIRIFVFNKQMLYNKKNSSFFHFYYLVNQTQT